MASGQKSSPPPQLARQCYSLECSSSSSSSSSSNSDEDGGDGGSLEILPPSSQPAVAATTASSRPTNLSLLFSSPESVTGRNRANRNCKTVRPSSSGSSATLRPPSSTSSTHPRRTMQVPPRLDLDSSDEDSSDDELLRRAEATMASSKQSSGSSRRALHLDLEETPLQKATKKRRSLTGNSKSIMRSTTPVDDRIRQQEKEQAKVRQDHERARRKAETEALKQKEKDSRQEKRERDRESKLRLKVSERHAKQVQTQQNQQVDGKFSDQEIVVLADSSIFHNDAYGLAIALREDFLLLEYPSALTCTSAVQWVRKEYLEGGANKAVLCLNDGKVDDYEHIPYLCLLLEPDDYIPLIQRSKEEANQDDFPALERWLQSLKSRWKDVWRTSKEPRVIIMLHKVAADLDRRWVNHRRSGNRTETSPPSEHEYQDSMQWLLIQFQVECIQCTTIEQIQDNIHKLTRGLAEAPYAKQVTELECVRKIKADATVGDDPYSRSHDGWLRQLQMIPNISENRARSLVQHYPTLQSLWQAYQDNDEAINRNLLNHCFDNGKSSQSALSGSVYEILTSTDPNKML